MKTFEELTEGDEVYIFDYETIKVATFKSLDTKIRTSEGDYDIDKRRFVYMQDCVIISTNKRVLCKSVSFYIQQGTNHLMSVVMSLREFEGNNQINNI